jgi:uncharacterized protein YdeI (YjbR/CyaY-like superfamily)
VEPGSAQQWRRWLEQHHGQDQGVWLVMLKKAAAQAQGRAFVTYDDWVRQALCFGWVDSKPRALDGQRSMLWMAPRRAGSAWSGANKARVAQLIQAGLMHPAGLAAVQRAQADGSWQALEDVETLQVPADLQAALAQWPPAAHWFAAFPASARRGILEWIAQAKTATTRSRRLQETARLAQHNLRAQSWPKPVLPPSGVTPPWPERNGGPTGPATAMDGAPTGPASAMDGAPTGPAAAMEGAPTGPAKAMDLAPDG